MMWNERKKEVRLSIIKLNFPITGDFALRNSQIDAHLSGELSMTKFGNKSSDFGGELYVRDGKFYYYGDVFNISDGYLVLDKKDSTLISIYQRKQKSIRN